MKTKSTQDTIKDLIKFNPLCLAFVIDSISKNVDMVLKDEQETLKQLENSFVHGPSWIETAKLIKQELNW